MPHASQWAEILYKECYRSFDSFRFLSHIQHAATYHQRQNISIQWLYHTLIKPSTSIYHTHYVINKGTLHIIWRNYANKFIVNCFQSQYIFTWGVWNQQIFNCLYQNIDTFDNKCLNMGLHALFDNRMHFTITTQIIYWYFLSTWSPYQTQFSLALLISYRPNRYIFKLEITSDP